MHRKFLSPILFVGIIFFPAFAVFAGSVTFPLPEPGGAANANFGGPRGNTVKLTDNSGNAIIDSTYGMFVPRGSFSYSLEYQELEGWSVNKENESGRVNLAEEQKSKILSKAWFIKDHVMDPDGTLVEARQFEYIEASVNIVDLYFGERGYAGKGVLGADQTTALSRPIATTTGDLNEDNIPDFANGTNASNSTNFSKLSPFTPVGFYIKGLNLDKAKIRFQYSGSNPADIEITNNPDGTKTYTPASGSLRLWTLDSTSQRNPASASSSGNGGKYITPAHAYKMEELDAAKVGDGHYVFYAEAIAVENTKITLEIDPLGDGHWITMDEITLLSWEVKVVNRDDPAKTWTTGAISKAPVAYTSPTIPEATDVKNGDLISWKIPILTGGNFEWWAIGPSGTRKNGQTGANKNEWKLEDPLDWLPGKWSINCRYTPSNGNSTDINFNQNLGYRSPDITVIGWIDGNQITLPNGTDRPTLRSGAMDDDTVSGWMSGNYVRQVGFLTTIAIGTSYTVPLGPERARRYVNAYLIKNSPNPAPRDSFKKTWSGYPDRSMVDDAELLSIKSQKDKFRSFHRFQAKFGLDETGKIKNTPNYIKQDTEVGDTPVDYMPDPNGEKGPHDLKVNTSGESIQFNPKNGKTSSAKLAEDFEQYTQGRISTNGSTSGGHISRQINNLKVPWIWSAIKYSANTAKAGTWLGPEHEIFPVYHIYCNGKRINSLTNAISEGKLEEFIQLGQPNTP